MVEAFSQIRAVFRRPVDLSALFASAVTALAAAVLLGAGGYAILNLRSFKYLGGLIFAGLAGVFFMALPRKRSFLLYCLGLSLPFFVQIILIQRGVSGLFTVTGTFIITLALALVVIATGGLRPGGILFESSISLPAVLFLCAALVSSVTTTDKTITLFAIAQELEMFFIFLVLINAIRDLSHLVAFLRGFYLGFAVECVIYILQNILGFSFDIVGNTRLVGSTDVEGGVIRSQRGTFAADVSTPALYFSIMALSLIGIYLCRRRLPLRLSAPLGASMGLACLILTAKRAPMGSFALGMIVISLLLSRHAPGANRKLIRVLAALVIPALILLPVLVIRAKADHVAAYEERMNLTRVAWNMYASHPIVGVGFGTYETLLRDYLPEDWSGWLFTVHNRYLRILAESGIVGFAALVVLYAGILRSAYRGIGRVDTDHRPLQISLLAALIAVCWEQYWDIFQSKPQGYMLWFLAALAVVLPRVLPRAGSLESS